MSKPGLTTPPSARAASPLNTSTTGNGNPMPSLSNTPPPPGDEMQPPPPQSRMPPMPQQQQSYLQCIMEVHESTSTTYDASRRSSTSSTRTICR